jgi:hypothetical protein
MLLEPEAVWGGGDRWKMNSANLKQIKPVVMSEREETCVAIIVVKEASRVDVMCK